MTEILCRWLNDTVQLSKRIEPHNFAEDLSSGYFLGEILYKYGLQDDFDQFSQNKNSGSKLNNFMRLQPTINLLDIEFNTNIARDIMQEKIGATTQILYQMFIALTNKEKKSLTGPIIESMRAGAHIKAEQACDNNLYQKNLKTKTPRQTDLNLLKLKSKFDKFQAEQEQEAFKKQFQEEENQRSNIQEKRSYLLNKSKEYKQRQAELYSKINTSIQKIEKPAAVVQVPKTPPHYKKETILERKRLFQRNEGEQALREIDSFDKRFKSKKMDGDLTIADLELNRGYDDANDQQQQIDPVAFLKQGQSDDYIMKIRNRLQEDTHARKEREKRRRKVLVDQLKANEALEESKREEALVSHLLRQSQFERRIAVELLHARHEKDVIRENRIINEREVLAKREMEFRDALDKERELARLAKLEYIEQARKDKEFHDLIAADRAEAKYKKHYEICSEIVGQIFDFSAKVAEYRELTDDLIPPKLWRDWLNMFRSGQPIQEEVNNAAVKDIEKVFNADIVAMNEDKAKLLDECDFSEYKEMMGEWEFPEKNNFEKPPSDNKIVGHIIQRLHDICYPVQPGAPKPIFPVFPLKAVVLGKPFVGKTTALKTVGKLTGMNILNTDDLILEAIEQYRKSLEEPVVKIASPPADETKPEEPKPDSKKSSNKMTNRQSPTESFKAAVVEIDVTQTIELSEMKMSTFDNFGSVETVDSTNELSDSNYQKAYYKPEGSEENIESHSGNAELEEQKIKKAEEEEAMKRYHTSSQMVIQLGELALNALTAGEAVKDEIIVHILTETIKMLPQDKGWLIDGFPNTFEQAKLLEKALTGFDYDNPVPPKPKRESVLAPYPKAVEAKVEHKSSIDLIIYLDISNETVLKRSVGRYCGAISQALYHLQFKEPPEGSFTGINKVETINNVRDPSHDMEQIQHRITLFEDNWPNIKTFYETYSSISTIAGESFDHTLLGHSVRDELDNFVFHREKKKQEEIEHKRMVEILLQQKKEEEERARLAAKRAAEEAAAEAEREAAAAAEATAAAETTLVAPSAKGKRSTANAKSKSPKGSKKAVSPAPSQKPKSPAASKLGKHASKATTPTGHMTPTQSIMTHESNETLESVKPGSADWVYVSDSLDNKIAKILCDHWDVTENCYINGTKHVFRKIRSEREQCIRYFFNVKTTFKEFLRRPDTKQVYLDAFVKEYNKISDDMREDEEVKAELHQRVADLNETLWSICDTKKAESEKERENVMNNGWLPDKTGIITNHYITLMQAELDRFQDTARMLKDYYRCMTNPVPGELPNDYPRLPLLDLKNPDEIEEEANMKEATSEKESTEGKVSPKASLGASPRNRSKSPNSKCKSPNSSKKASQLNEKNAKSVEVVKKKIPLISRGDNGGGDKDKKPIKNSKPKNPEEVSPPPPEDPDEKLIFDAFKNASSFVNNIIHSEQTAIQVMEAEAGDVPPPQEDTKAKKGGKASAMGKPPASAMKPKSAAKGGKGAAPPPVINSDTGLTEDEKEKLAKLQKSNKEYMAALKKEEGDFKVRLELIKQIANKVITELKARAETSYTDMFDWLGVRFNKEINSIKNLCNYIKFRIENSKKIKKELILVQDDFIINADVIVMRTPSPPPRPEAVEIIPVENFTIDSLRKMHKQFELVAPEGLVATKTFVDIFNDLILLNFGNEILPEQWSNISQSQIEHLARMLASGSEFVDWRHWLLAASMPWVYPTQTELLNLLSEYKKIDSGESGLISKEQYMQTPLWFKIDKPKTPADIKQPHSYDRHHHLISFWFDVFATAVPVGIRSESGGMRKTVDTTMKLDYKHMLLSIAAVSDPYEGFLRALSVSQEAPMPRIEPKVQMKVPQFNTPEYEQLKLNSAISETFPEDQIVSIDAIYRVFHHGERQRGDTHRFAQTEDPEDFMSYQRVASIFADINEEPVSTAPYSKLIAHPVLCEMISICTKFRTPDFRTVFNLLVMDDTERDRDSPNE